MFLIFILFFKFSDFLGLICYKPILDLILFSEIIKDKNRNFNSKNSQELQFKTNSSENNENRERSVLNDQILKEKENIKMAPILTILAIVRKSLRKFILSPEDFQGARSVMIKVFRSFDPQEKHKLSTRDFCLAVSVLINEIRQNDDIDYINENRNMNILNGNNRELNNYKKNISNINNETKENSEILNNSRDSVDVSRKQKNIVDRKIDTNNIDHNTKKSLHNGRDDINTNLGNDVPILSKQEWNSIFHHFATKPKNQSNNVQMNNRTYEEMTVDYQKFCDSVLNYNEIKKLINLTVSVSNEKKRIIEKTKKISTINDVNTASNRVHPPGVSTYNQSLRYTFDDRNISDKNIIDISLKKKKNDNNTNNNNDDNNNSNKPFITGKYKNQTERILFSGSGKYQK